MDNQNYRWIKIVLVSTIFVLLVGVGAYFAMNRLIENTLTKNFKESAMSQADIIDKSVEQYLKQVYNDIDMLVAFPSFRGVGGGLSQYVTLKERSLMKPTEGSEEERHLYEIIRLYGESHPGTLYVYLATQYGGYLCWPEVEIVPRYDPRVRPWYMAAVEAKGKIVQTDPYVDLVTNKLIISNVKAIYDERGKVKGVLGIDVSMNEISSVLSQANTVGKGTYLVVHDSGLILSDASNKDNAFKYVSQIYPSINEFYDKDGMFNSLIQNETYYGLSKKIQNTNWHIVVLVPKKTLFSASEPYIRNLSLGTIGTVILVMIIIFSGSYMIFYNRSLQKMVYVRTKDLQGMIDELILKDQTLRGSEARLRSLVENIPGVVYRCEPVAPWKMQTMSNWVETLTGYEASSFLGESPTKNWSDVIYFEDVKRVSAVETVTIGDYFEIEYRVLDIHGNIKWVFERGGLIIGDDGKPYMDGIIFDITDRKQAEQEIQRIYEELENRVDDRTKELKNAMSQLVEQEKMASLGGIVSGVAHEINTPLGISVTIASYLRKLHDEMVKNYQEGTLSKNKLQDFIAQNVESYDILETNLARAAELVNSFKKISVNQSNEEVVLFNLNEYIQMILLSLKHEYKNKGYEIEVLCDPEIEIYSYPGVFSQIITNLLMNSLIHGFKNREEGLMSIRVTRSKDQKRLTLIYEDNGVGIPKASLDKIFEPFFTTNRANGGSGLGLYIVYNLVMQKLNGSIKCKSEIGSGTSFIVSIPLSTPIFE